MLYTNLNHIETAADLAKRISENENAVVICGRMGPMCIPVYRIAEELEEDYKHVKFFDMEFDNPESNVIRSLSEVESFTGIPFTIYYKNGKVVQTTTSIQSKLQITSILEKEFAAAVTDPVVFPDLSIRGSFPFGCDIKSDVTIRSLDLEGNDRNAFRW